MIVFRMSLEIDKPETVRAGGEMHTGILTGDQYFEVCGHHLFRENLVPSGMRYVKAGVCTLNQRVGKTDLVGKDTPALGRQWLPFDTVEILERGMGCQASAKRRGDVGTCPVQQVAERFPERLIGQFRMNRVGATDNQGIQPRVL